MKRSLGPCTLLSIGALCALGCDAPATKAILTATPEAVTLVQDTEALCVKTGKAGVERFEGQSPAGDVETALHEYFDGEAAPQLAAVDKAGELIADLMPKVREESSPETVRAVEDLFETQKTVCKAARTPRSTKLDFQDSLKYAVNDYVAARDKLAALYTVPDADAQFARHKFSPLLDEARASAPRPEPAAGVRVASAKQYDQERAEWEKAQEYQARQQAEHEAAVSRWRTREETDKNGARQPLVGLASAASPQPAQVQQTMQTMQSWYAGYSGKVQPVRAALASYLEVRRGQNEEIQPVCQELLNATAALLADPATLEPPDRMASQALKRAYAELRECAQACVTGRNAEATFSLGAYQSALRDAAAALRPYSVVP
jgi:hypothetical protein